ncbi:MAG TPA: hypothetical protein VJQ57_09600 [Acidimicrobiia bacterium]|nr:hypothetical protein [Acidimicrobiia bacterium]
MGRSLLSGSSLETIADEVDRAIATLGIEDLHGRAGRHEWGYVEPTEAAWEILEEAIEPFVEEIRRRIELGLEKDALEICKGVVLGLHRVEQGKVGGLVEWAPDFPTEAACGVIETWRKARRPRTAAAADAGRSRGAFPQQFMTRLVPEWQEMIGRVAARRR